MASLPHTLIIHMGYGARQLLSQKAAGSQTTLTFAPLQHYAVSPSQRVCAQEICVLWGGGGGENRGTVRGPLLSTRTSHYPEQDQHLPSFCHL